MGGGETHPTARRTTHETFDTTITHPFTLASDFQSLFVMIQSFSPVGGSVGSRIRPSGHGSSSFGRFGRFGRRLGGPSRPCLSLSLARASFSDEQSDHEDVDHEPAFFYDEYRTNEHLKVGIEGRTRPAPPDLLTHSLAHSFVRSS